MSFYTDKQLFQVAGTMIQPLTLGLRSHHSTQHHGGLTGVNKYQFGCGISMMVGPKKQDSWPIEKKSKKFCL